MDNTDELRCISLCSGYEGLGLGIRRVLPNVRIVAYSEIEEYACSVLAARMAEGKLDVAPIWTNLKTFPCFAFRGRVHGITAGYPCQPFSVAGKRRGTEDPRHLWPYIRRAIGIIRPDWCFLENVPGHVKLGLREVLLDLEELGYRVESDNEAPTWGLFTAAEVGAPHRRQRLFILAVAAELRCNGLPVGEPRRAVEERWVQEPAGTRLQQARIESVGGGERLADAGRNRSKTGVSRQEQRQEGDSGITNNGCIERWPARPGQPQYEWEEPRVVVEDPNKRGLGKSRVCKEQPKRTEIEQPSGQGQAQSVVGRAANGPAVTTYGVAHRVDRLRLLGNGVVPQQAELAFRELIKTANGQMTLY